MEWDLFFVSLTNVLVAKVSELVHDGLDRFYHLPLYLLSQNGLSNAL